MRTVQTETEAGARSADGGVNITLKYPATYQEFDSVTEYVELRDEDALLRGLNAAQKQNATQGRKEDVRDAMEAAIAEGIEGGLTGDELKEFVRAHEKVVEAIATHQERIAAYLLGRPRGARAGFTKTKARKLIDRIRETAGEEELKSLAEQYGIDPESLV